MQLKTILTALVAVLVVVFAAPTADISAVLPGPRLSKAVVDINDNLNEELNDTTSKIIVYPDGGGGRSYPVGGRPPTIIIIGPYPHGPVLLKRPRKRSGDADDEKSNILVVSNLSYPSGYPSGRPFPKRDADEASKATYYKPGVGYYPPSTYYPTPRKRSNDADEASKILIISGAGPRPHYPPVTFPGYPPSIYQQGYRFEGLSPFGKRASVEAKSSKEKAKAEVENEVDWEDDYDGEEENEDVKYSLIYPPSPYWDPRRPHIMNN
ncbi:hypothetical protein BG015_011574 [Linnemannia schmuckeri]|uniref:Uncharacterized protein n=1 Tax=Linnemannia schmuckeri TaxID=64567 RepID=A0A9P5RUJ7_9FUNG|nr:hypothetical protein BG015_011574 [Linnemannia schmuckeri]